LNGAGHPSVPQEGIFDDNTKRENCWTQSIATGSRSFVEAVKRQMRGFAIGRRVQKKAEGFELRESQSPYKAFFDTEKVNIRGKTYGFGMNKKGYRNVSLAQPHLRPQKGDTRPRLFRVPAA